MSGAGAHPARYALRLSVNACCYRTTCLQKEFRRGAERSAGFFACQAMGLYTYWHPSLCRLPMTGTPAFSCFRLTLLSGNRYLYRHTGIMVYTCYCMYQSFQIISVHNCTLSL